VQTGAVGSDPPDVDAETLAAIDIGTNSVHLVVARMTPGPDGPRFEVLEREKEMVRLGSGSGDMRELTPDAIDRGIEALHRFRQVAAVHDADREPWLRAVATSAVREAENRDVFIDRAWDEADVHVDVISGVEEARLIHLGVLQAVPVFDHQLLLVDIGGGSTELLVGKHGEVLASRSHKLGSIRLTQRFFGGDRLHPAAVDSCRRFVRSTIAPFAREVRRLGFEVAVGSSGTIGALATMAAAQADRDVPRSVSNLVLRTEELDAVVDLLRRTDVADRASLPGLDPKRADIILAGAIILEQVLHDLDVAELTVSDNALREGVLLDAWRRRHGGSLDHLSDLRRRSVLHLLELMDDDPGHAVQVARLALEVFDATVEVHGLPAGARETLEAAAMLSNVGLFIAHSQHHKHSYYVIRSSEHLSGFTDHEVELIAVVARYHRKADPAPKHPEFASLRRADQELVRTLAGMLRVAIGLDRNHGARVHSLRCDISDEQLVVRVTAQPGEDIALELYAADARKGLLEAALGRAIAIVEA
jgi:exopolyphosphatase / guanosine-5'-triphosphate,3'-diphosphate pyrophosphatase